MKQINCIQEIRGYGILWVIFGHLSFIEDKYSGGTDILPGYIMFGHSGVDAFFVVSGFMMVYINQKKTGGLRSLMSFIYDRAVRVYPVYWLYCLLLLPAYFLFPQVINVAEGNQVSLFRSLFLLPSEHLPLLPVAWTLIHEIYFYSIVALLMLFSPQVRWIGMLLWGLLCLVLTFTQVELPFEAPVVQMLENPINLEFVMGAVIAEILLSGRSAFAIPTLVIGLTLYIAGYWYYVETRHVMVLDKYYRVLFAGVPLALIIYGLVVLENQKGFTFAKPLQFIGNMSYSVYLSHVMVLSVIGKLWYESKLQGLLYTPFWLALCLGICLLWGYLSFRYIENPSWQYAKKRNPFYLKKS